MTTKDPLPWEEKVLEAVLIFAPLLQVGLGVRAVGDWGEEGWDDHLGLGECSHGHCPSTPERQMGIAVPARYWEDRSSPVWQMEESPLPQLSPPPTTLSP